MVIHLTSYEASLDYLFARTTGAFRFGLERTTALLRELGDPHRSYPVIHIAGTNGKGSSVATAYALLRAKGLRVARYTSPHLVEFRERIMANDVPVSPLEIVEFIERNTPMVERIGASFFEATTAMAFQHFANEQVDVALIETGLGGRLDSTNVVSPIAAGVTSIGFDHTEYLGPTLEAIAHEKAGIFKAGVPAVIGEPDPVVRDILAAAARANNAIPTVVSETSTIEDVHVVPAGTRFTLTTLGERVSIETPLIGEHQAPNFAFTLALLNAAGDAYRVSPGEAMAAVSNVRLPGRFQRVGRWIFDVAHNADGVRTLRETLNSLIATTPLTILLCVLGDKDWRSMIESLASLRPHFILTDAPTAPSSRAWNLGDVAAFAADRQISAESVQDFDAALRTAEAREGITLVTGSFHTVGDAMSRLQVSPFAG